MTKILVNKEVMEIETGELTILTHPNELEVDVPEFVEVSPRSTIKTVENLHPDAWKVISQNFMFRRSFNMLFAEIPATLEELLESDLGVQHVAGMIIQTCEAVFDGKNVFFRLPETYLSPDLQRLVLPMLEEIRKPFLSEKEKAKYEEEQNKRDKLNKLKNFI